MSWMAMITLLMAAAPTSDQQSTTDQKTTEAQTALLKVFRSEFIAITPGEAGFPQSFMMGSASGNPTEQPKHQVTFKYTFHIARFEVPQNLWESVMGKNPSRWPGPRNSVEMLDFQDAVDFCTKTTQLMRDAKLIKSDQIIRLPAEAEWEYVARAGTDTVYSFGDDVQQLNDYGWSTVNAAGNDPPVGAKKPNPWKLYDIHGYLWEWCADSWHPNYQKAPTDGSAWLKDGDAKRAVLRGGSWKDKPEKLTSRYRLAATKTLKDAAVGLRCVLATQTFQSKNSDTVKQQE